MQKCSASRAAARDGRLVLPDGMSYRYLVLPHEKSWKGSPAVLGKLAELAEGGLTLIGPPPVPRGPGLTDYPQCDRQVRRLVQRIWGDEDSRRQASGERRIGKGRVIWGKIARRGDRGRRTCAGRRIPCGRRNDLTYAKPIPKSSEKSAWSVVRSSNGFTAATARRTSTSSPTSRPSKRRRSRLPCRVVDSRNCGMR